MSPSLPVWVSWVKALAPTTIAIVALVVTGWIQWGLSRTARNKLKLDLFDQRVEMLRVIEEIGRTILRRDERDWSAAFLGKIQDVTTRLDRFRLLFPAPLGTRVDALISLCFDFVTIQAELDGGLRSDERPNMVTRRRAVLDKMEVTSRALKTEVADFIRLEWKG